MFNVFVKQSELMRNNYSIETFQSHANNRIGPPMFRQNIIFVHLKLKNVMLSFIFCYVLLVIELLFTFKLLFCLLLDSGHSLSAPVKTFDLGLRRIEELCKLQFGNSSCLYGKCD